MKNIWEEREKVLENEFIHRRERELIEKMKSTDRQRLVREICRDHCPKCGEMIQAITFRGVPLDKCPHCGGIWLGPNDLKILAAKDHRSWFEKWFKAENESDNVA